jgi:ribosome-binding factor A
MSQRVAKVESLVQQVVASAIYEYLAQDAAYLTVTAVDVSPDLRHAIVWIGSLGSEAQQKKSWEQLIRATHDIQSELNARMATKFIPRIDFRADAGGEHAAEIEKLLRDTR